MWINKKTGRRDLTTSGFCCSSESPKMLKDSQVHRPCQRTKKAEEHETDGEGLAKLEISERIVTL